MVQRGTEHFHTWYGKSADTFYLTRRVRFNNQCFPNAAGDANDQHTDQPGEVNLSYWWGCGGPSPIREWRNIRNKNVSGFVDLDGEPFPLQRNSDIVEGSICRITSDAGWSSWHEIDFKGANDGIGFQTQYTNDAGRERTDLKVEGVENTYKPANGEILTLDFLDPEANSAFSDIQDDDLLLAWDGSKNRKVTGATFKTLFDDDFDYDQCMNDARAEYLRVMSLCESTYCCDIAYREYKEDIDECHEAAGLPPPSSYPAQLPCRA